MKVEFIPVTGSIVSYGNSTSENNNDGTPSGVWMYSYITVKEAATGREVIVNDCKIIGALNQHITRGETGTFLFTKALGNRELLGFRDEERQTLNPHVGNMPNMTFFFVFCYFIGAVTTLILIGIPIILATMWLQKTYKKLPDILEKGLSEHGFDGARSVQI